MTRIANIYSQWGFLPLLGAVKVCIVTDMPVVNPAAQSITSP
jgi:hypothetical protein